MDNSDMSTDYSIARVFLSLTIPNIISSMFNMLPAIANLLIAGHCKDQTDLAVVGVGINLCNLVTLSISHGINTSQDTFTTQAFGNKQLEQCGILLNRGFMISSAIAIPSYLILILFGE